MSNLKKGTLNCGFEYEIDITTVENMRFLGLLGKIETDPLSFPRALEMLFGEKQLNDMYLYLESKDIVPNVEHVGAILTEVIESVSELKNS